MKAGEMIELGFSNLWRTKLRTFLTVLGVMIGIGALTSMISFGTGMEKNIRDVFEQNDLFTSIYITPIEIDLEKVSTGDLSGLAGSPEKKAVPLNDSILQVIRGLEGVDVAFPEETFSAKVRILGEEKTITASSIPTDLKNYPPFDQITFGDFFDNDSSRMVVLRWEMLKRMKIIVAGADEEITLSEEEKEKGFKIVPPDSVIGKSLVLTTVVLDPIKLLINFLVQRGNLVGLPVRERNTDLTIGGILKRQTAFSQRDVRGEVFIPVKTAREIPKLGLSSIWDFLDSNKQRNQYNSLFVNRTPSLSKPILIPISFVLFSITCHFNKLG